MKTIIGFALACILSFRPEPLPNESILTLTSTDTTAESTYEKAVLLLHNFQYEDAAELFLEVQKRDPGQALAYWGEAMTYDHPVWGDNDIDKARAALNKLGVNEIDRTAKAKTGLEKDLLKSVEILFGTGTKPDRQHAYAQFMQTLYKKYPGNIDIAAFYSLALLGNKKSWNEWEEYNVEAARVAAEILTVKPNHPGALHYMVHANDHPRYANAGLEAANRYAAAASYSGHALHMPSHIYLALGMWDDVVRSNEVSWKASVDRKESRKENNDDLSYHSHLWLQYGYLQQGRFRKAREILDKQLLYTTELPSAIARVHLLQMKGHYLFETDDWSSPIADLAIRTDDLMTASRYNAFFLESYKAFKKNDHATLKLIVSTFESSLKSDALLQKANENVTICGVTRFVRAVPTSNEIQAGTKLLAETKGMNAWLNKDYVQAEKYFMESLPREGSVVIGPLFNLLSAHELYGRFLLDMKRPENAYEQFDKALNSSPNRIISLKGKLAASRMMNDSAKEKAVLTQLKKDLLLADPEARKNL